MNRYFAIFCFVVSWPVYALAGIIHVPGDQPTIQAGINAAVNGDTVLVADSTYYENINFKGKAITVASCFLTDEDIVHIDSTIIDGSQPSNPDSGSVVYFISGEDNTSVLCGFTITNGTGTYSAPGPPPSNFPLRQGGGIFCNQSGPIIKKNYIIINSCILNEAGGITAGGGISAGPPGSNAFIIIENNKIMNNNIWSQGSSASAWAQGGGIALAIDGRVQNNELVFNECKSTNGYSGGGGIRVGFSATVDIIDDIISNNTSISVNSYGFAGGISNSAANTLIKLSRITNNSIAGIPYCYGAAIYFDLDNDVNWAVVENNIISENYHTNGLCYGGAIGIYTSSPGIYNNIISNNSAHYGGALYAFDNSKPELINNTIAFNTANQSGGALYSEDATTNPIIVNTIMWDNTAAVSGNEIDLYNGGNATLSFCDIKGGWTGQGNIDADPFFVDSIYNLADSSRCIGAGIDSIEISGIWYYAPSFDYDGDPRPMPSGSMPDIGAQESDFVTSIVLNGSNKIPKTFSLKQNYPNPFNPSTTIEFALPQTGCITLKIYNILGEEVAMVVSEKLAAGKYKYDWDASGLASGVYLYCLETGSFKQTKKLVLLK